ncbi:SAM-dependent methyltransferase [Stutzerimonas kirkiae]|uniref:SAM-dependent methyltransferase n=1 Tax=Stutzerimonas kirkiae TaxID=2211392 RepID=A0A4Q9R340_9GAMM|nr:class I SAM-dependent methyltransferase [Stutzerimonas kirkiae]TBU92861.1 SAM-dependent methyltransferase [Stutzerimonas kirkiae]TBV01324.1 SAM-dependent methyltransferase [Stutzerimonas kirkiae]
MKQCLACGSAYPMPRRDCPACRAAPAIVDGFDAYAPDLAHAGGGFEVDCFAELAHREAANFWFRARNRLILWALGRYAPGFSSLLEIGCGTGFVLAGIAAHFPQARLAGSEIFTAGLAFAAQRLPGVDLMQMDARHIPFAEAFEVVGAFDVLEHIAEDEAVLGEIHRTLQPGGVLLLTVPQHAWLWSAADEYAHHQRRYGGREIGEKIRAAGFEVVRSTSFVTTLLPAMLLSRLGRKRDDIAANPRAELELHPVLNYAFERMLDLECTGIRLGLNYPVGGTRLVVARKPQSSSLHHR